MLGRPLRSPESRAGASSAPATNGTCDHPQETRPPQYMRLTRAHTSPQDMRPRRGRTMLSPRRAQRAWGFLCPHTTRPRRGRIAHRWDDDEGEATRGEDSPCAIRPLRGRRMGRHIKAGGSLRSPPAKHNWTPSGPLVLGKPCRGGACPRPGWATARVAPTWVLVN